LKFSNVPSLNLKVMVVKEGPKVDGEELVDVVPMVDGVQVVGTPFAVLVKPKPGCGGRCGLDCPQAGPNAPAIVKIGERTGGNVDAALEVANEFGIKPCRRCMEPALEAALALLDEPEEPTE